MALLELLEFIVAGGFAHRLSSRLSLAGFQIRAVITIGGGFAAKPGRSRANRFETAGQSTPVPVMTVAAGVNLQTQDAKLCENAVFGC